VGRSLEVSALIDDLDRIIDSGAAVRLVIGEYGSGKSFFLQLIRSIALEKNLATMHADLTPDRRLQATGGQARTLYAELASNVATRTNPEGGGLPSIVERFISSAMQAATKSGSPVTELLDDRLHELSQLVGGYDFSAVIQVYWDAHDNVDTQRKEAAIRWLRGEFTTKTDARRALGVRTIIDDANVYDQLKLLARFTKLAGYEGLVVVLDEMVNLYKLANTTARNNNYEQILRIVNDCLQGSVESLGFLMGGTPEFLTDTRRGLYSNDALQTRLAENTFATGGLRDLSGPVIRLSNLAPEEIFVLLTKLRHVHASGDPAKYVLPDEGIEAFMIYCSDRIGSAYFRTPRNSIRAFVQLLAVLDQNPEVPWESLLSSVDLSVEKNPDLEPLPASAETEAPLKQRPAVPPDDELSKFQL
jgi:hypothetical protein